MSVRRLILLFAVVVLIGGAILYPRVRSLVAPQDADAQQTSSATPSPASAAPGSAAPAGAAAASHTGKGRSGAAPTIAVYSAVAQQQTVPITQNYVGQVESIAQVAVRPRIDGMIVELPVVEGQEVKAGDLLFQLDDAGIQASIAKDQATMTKDQATLDQSKADLGRSQTLLGHGDATAQAVQQQQAAVEVANGSVAADKAQLQSDQIQLGYTKITAPISGRIGAINVSQGALVHASDTTTLLTITEMAPVRVSFSIPERDLAAFRSALASKSPPQVTAIDANTGKTIATGTLTFIDSSVDTSSGTVVLKGQFDNADEALWPGAYVGVLAQLGSDENAITVPAAAVQLNGDESFVFLVQPNSTVTRRTVTVARTVGTTAVIASGVKPGDHVVVEGQLRLVEGSRIKETLASAAPATTTTVAIP
jgi:multidrug efflux system membrane fusion protein